VLDEGLYRAELERIHAPLKVKAFPPEQDGYKVRAPVNDYLSHPRSPENGNRAGRGFSRYAMDLPCFLPSDPHELLRRAGSAQSIIDCAEWLPRLAKSHRSRWGSVSLPGRRLPGRTTPSGLLPQPSVQDGRRNMARAKRAGRTTTSCVGERRMAYSKIAVKKSRQC